ncbi:Uncharacterised protein [Chlamydia trachomatis]|nr:Uncharacterised protein [Chlamydia trachomatis]
MAMLAANMAVIPPVMATTCIAAELAMNNGNMAATRYTPAATMVAACINAETGVGPSIASGSHV